MSSNLSAVSGRVRLLATAAILPFMGMTSGAGANVVISSAATANITCTSGVCTASKKAAVLNVSQLESMLASGNVKVMTDDAREASDIVVSAPFSWASGHSLTLDASQSITIDKAVAVDGTGGLSLVTNDGGTGGELSFGAKGTVSFLSTSNSLTINGNAYTLVGNIATLASDIAGNANGYYALSASYNATPDGTYALPPVQTTFSGTFEGLGNTISHLTIESASYGLLGLFSEVDTNGTIENLRLRSVAISGGFSVQAGGLVANNYGTLFDDSVAGKIVGDGGGAEIGGLVGVNTGSIAVCYAEGSVTGSHSQASDAPYIGGLVGVNSGFPTVGTITDSYATASVQGERGASVGGLVGYVDFGTIANSYATGSATGGRASFVGGLIGMAGNGEAGLEPDIDSSYATGAVVDTENNFLGGLIGSVIGHKADIANTYWDTTTSGITNSSQGVGNINNYSGVTAMSTSQLQSGLPTGFSSSIWGESVNINSGLPYLLAIPPS